MFRFCSLNYTYISVFLASYLCLRLVYTTHLTLSTVKEPSFIPSARWMPSVLTAAQRMGSSMLQRAIKAWSIRLHILHNIGKVKTQHVKDVLLFKESAVLYMLFFKFEDKDDFCTGQIGHRCQSWPGVWWGALPGPRARLHNDPA